MVDLRMKPVHAPAKYFFNPHIPTLFLHPFVTTGGVKLPPRGISVFRGTYERNYNGYTHVLEVRHFYGANRYVPEVGLYRK